MWWNYMTIMLYLDFFINSGGPDHVYAKVFQTSWLWKYSDNIFFVITWRTFFISCLVKNIDTDYRYNSYDVTGLKLLQAPNDLDKLDYAYCVCTTVLIYSKHFELKLRKDEDSIMNAFFLNVPMYIVQCTLT